MDIGVVIGFAVCAGALALAMDLSESTVRMVGGMFHAPDLGWPSCVQEDDDLHWSWAAQAPTADGRQRVADPPFEEVDPRSIRLRVQPLRRGERLTP
jgi:hypothetical protein